MEWLGISFSRGIFPTQGSNPGHRRQTLHPLSLQGSPQALHWGFWHLPEDSHPAEMHLPGLPLPVPHPWRAPANLRLCRGPAALTGGPDQSPVGQCSVPLGSSKHKVLFVLSLRMESVLPQSCASPVIKSHWPSESDSLGIPSP